MDEPVAKQQHSLTLRWMHWINFPVLMVMAYSGMRIYWADVRDPYAIGIGSWTWFRFWPDSVEEKLQLQRHLAAGIAFHLTFAWFFVANGVAYAVHLMRKNNWRRIIPDRRSVRDSARSVLHDLHLVKERPPQGKYNPAQQMAYTAVLVMATLLVASGFAIYKSVQLAWLTWLLGGYETARLIHFSMTIGLLSFFVVHVLQVARAGWRNPRR
ncbi:MAG: cytochrome b/b6 domain-containing protein [Ilumatobacteraceae bacterium]